MAVEVVVGQEAPAVEVVFLLVREEGEDEVVDVDVIVFVGVEDEAVWWDEG